MSLSPTLEPNSSRGRVDTRQRLIRSAVALFQQRGYHGVGTAEILEAAKAPRGSLYHHFPNGKCELAVAAVVWLTDEIVHSIQRKRLAGYVAAEIVTRIGAEIAAWLEAKDYKEGSLLATLVSSLGSSERVLAGAIKQSFERIEAEYAQMLKVDNPGISDAGQSASRLVSALEGAMILARARRNASLVVETAKTIAADLRKRG